LKLGFLKGFGAVTAIAVTAEAADVDIITTMAGETLGRNTVMFCKGRAMAVVTHRLFVFTLQGVVGLLVMIKLPQEPIIRCMTLATLLTEAAFVIVIGLMARDALHIRLLKLSIKMAGFTGSDTVNADEWKLGKIMFEKDRY
jgi:hypothetical protein